MNATARKLSRATRRLFLPRLAATTVLVGFAAMLTFAPLATAQQNVITNGDFSQADAQGNPVAWIVQNFDHPALVKPFDTDGSGVNPAFECTHGAAQTSTNAAGDLIQRNILLLPGLTYEFRADVAVGGGFNNDPGKFEVIVGGQSVAVADMTTARGPKALGVTFRERICARFTLPSNPIQEITIRISRTFASLPGRTPQAYVDNVFLAFIGSAGPTICPRGERLAGSPLNLEVVGRPGTLTGLFVGLGLLPTPITIPGWSGAIALQPPMLLAIAASTDAQGVLALPVQTLAHHQGVQVYLQATQVQPPPSTGLNFGLAQMVNLY